MPDTLTPVIPLEVIDPTSAPVETLTKIREIIATRWLKGGFGRKGQPVCLLGAAREVCTGYADTPDLYQEWIEHYGRPEINGYEAYYRFLDQVTSHWTGIEQWMAETLKPCAPEQFIGSALERCDCPSCQVAPKSLQVAGFNDHPDTTQEDVLGALDCAIAKASQG